MMSMLSQLSPSRRRPALLRRLPFWAQALAVCGLFAIAGVALVDDYGVGLDEIHQRRVAIVNADYIAARNIDLLYLRDDRYYGITTEMPLLLAERALRLRDSRHINLTRHFLAHLFFIAGGFACGMLAYRMMGSRWIALLAMMMFLLHPRLYSQSLFNTKDVPFAALLVLALYLAHRAFRRDTLGAFLLCGIVVGLAINLRPFALMLLPMILAMRALDFWRAGGGERKHILATAGIFAGAALAMMYITYPYYWENPLRFIESVRVLSQHPTIVNNLFMGEIYPSDAVPWNYIPVWFAITAPPVALALGAIGCAAICWQAITPPLAAIRDRETRFLVLLLCCFALPIVVVIALQSNIYNGWRHMYFLWAPFCLLAAVGLRRLAGGGSVQAGWGIAARLPGWVRGGGMRRTLAYGIAGVGLITTLTAMAALHPYEYLYFNALTDTKTPDALANRYDMDYWEMAQRQSLEHLIAQYPDSALRVWPEKQSARILPQNVRERIASLHNPHAADFYLLSNARGRRMLWKLARDPRELSFYIHPRVNLTDIPERPAIHAIRAYGSVVASIVARDEDAVDAYRAAYHDVAANGDLLARADFDIYAYDGALYYLSANCELPQANVNSKTFLHIFPADAADLPAGSREHGFENRDFLFRDYGAFFDGKCIHRQALPDYPIARIRTGQNAAALGGDAWRTDIDLAARAGAQALYDGIVAGDYGAPVAQSHFALYLRDNALIYLKENCSEGDMDARFFLHIFPSDPANLPADRRESGFANLDFQFADHGARIDDICVATRELPGYAIERIRTGQFISGEGNLWRVEFPAAQ